MEAESGRGEPLPVKQTDLVISAWAMRQGHMLRPKTGSSVDGTFRHLRTERGDTRDSGVGRVRDRPFTIRDREAIVQHHAQHVGRRRTRAERVRRVEIGRCTAMGITFPGRRRRP